MGADPSRGRGGRGEGGGGTVGRRHRRRGHHVCGHCAGVRADLLVYEEPQLSGGATAAIWSAKRHATAGPTTTAKLRESVKWRTCQIHHTPGAVWNVVVFRA